MLDIQFPLIQIHKDYMVGRLRNRNQMCIASELKMRPRKAEDFSFLDANGNYYHVTEMTFVPVSRLPILKRFLFLSNFLAKEKSIWIDFNLIKVRQLSLEEMKETVFGKICDLHPRWKKDGPSQREKKGEIFSTSSFKELINYVSIHP